MTCYGPRELAASFRTVRKNTLLVAADIAEADYAFRPAPECRSVAEIFAHIAVVTGSSHRAYAVDQIKTFAGVDFVAFLRERQAQEQQLQTKAQILDALGRSGEEWAAYLDGVSDASLAEVIEFPPGAEPPRKSLFEIILGLKEHEMHHRAQLMLIERLLGIVPHLTRQRQARMAQADQARR